MQRANPIGQFLRSAHGAALIEFAFVFPFMLLLFLGGVEVTRYILIVQRVEKTAYMMTSILSQENPAKDPLHPTPSEFTATVLQTNGFDQFDRLMNPYADNSKTDEYRIIFTSIVHRRADNTAVPKVTEANFIRWQASVGTLSDSGGVVQSVVNGGLSANACDKATFPNDARMQKLFSDGGLNSGDPAEVILDNENILVGEVFFQYEPMIKNLLGISNNRFGMDRRIIVQRIFLHPRKGSLMTLPPNVTSTNDCQ